MVFANFCKPCIFVLITILVFSRRRGGRNFLFFCSFFFFTICKFFEVLKSTPNAGTQLVQQFFLQYQDLIYFLFLFVFAGYQNTIQSNNVFFYVIVNSRSLQINSIYVCVFSVQEVQQYVRANLSLLFLKGNFFNFLFWNK